MFGANYLGQPYFGQGYAGTVGGTVWTLEGSVSGMADVEDLALALIVVLDGIIDGTADAVAALIMNLELAGIISGSSEAALNLTYRLARLATYGYRITWED
jgi:hypothetical protein